MQPTKHLIGITIIFTAIVAIIGSTTPKKAFDDNSNGWLPADFSPKNGTLLIERVTTPKAQGEKIEAYMEKNYPYKYEFVNEGQWETDSKYEDKESYPFVLVLSVNYYQRVDSRTGRTGVRYSSFDFNFVDRVNDKPYPPSGISSSWASMTFEAIIKKVLEKNP